MKRRTALTLLGGASALALLEGSGHLLRRVLRFSGPPDDWPPPPKRPGAVRILCLGESSTYGIPFGPQLSWPAMLQFLLGKYSPGTHWDVVNAGASGADMADICATLDKAGPCEADLAILMSGHNEFYRAFLDVEYLPGVRTDNGRLHMSRLLLPSTVSKLPRWITLLRSGSDDPAESLAAWYPAFLDFQRRLQTSSVVQRYVENMEGSIAKCRKLDCPLVAVTAPSNVLSWLPYVSDPVKAAQWAGLMRSTSAGTQSTAVDRDAEALQFYASGIYGWDSGRFRDGLINLTTALGSDVNRIRATPEIRRSTRETAEAAGQHCFDLAGRHLDSLENGELQPDIFLDHCHYTPAGAMWIARQIFGELIELGKPVSINRQDMNMGNEIEDYPEFLENSSLAANELLEGFQAIAVIDRFYEQWPLVRRVCELALASDPECSWARGTLAQLEREKPGFTSMGDLDPPIPYENIPARFGPPEIPDRDSEPTAS